MEGADLSLSSRTEGGTQSCHGTGGGQAPSLLPPHGQQEGRKRRTLEGNPRLLRREFPPRLQDHVLSWFSQHRDADPGSIDTDSMTTLTSSLLRTGAAGKGAGRRSTPALLPRGCGLLPAPAQLSCPTAAPFPLQGPCHCHSTRGTCGAGVSHPSHTRCSHRAKHSRVLDPVSSSFRLFASLSVCSFWQLGIRI